MKNKTLAGTACLIVSIGLSSAAIADMTGDDNYRANAQLAIADVDGLDTGTAIVLTGVKPMSQVNRAFAVEAEFTTTATAPEKSNVEASYYTLGGYAAWNHKVSPKVALKGRAGLLYEDVEVEIKGTNIKEDDSNVEVSYGIGATYNLGKQIDLIAEYTQIESDISHLGAGVQWKF